MEINKLQAKPNIYVIYVKLSYVNLMQNQM